MKYTHIAKVIVLKKGIPPAEIKLICPVCGYEIIFIINPQTETVIEIYADAREESEKVIECGICNSLLEWSLPTFPKQKNPSRRK